MDMSYYIKTCSLTFWIGKNTIDTGTIGLLAIDEITHIWVMLPTGSFQCTVHLGVSII